MPETDREYVIAVKARSITEAAGVNTSTASSRSAPKFVEVCGCKQGDQGNSSITLCRGERMRRDCDSDF
jgi:hypothetical protein